jgi:hypothetical protein
VYLDRDAAGSKERPVPGGRVGVFLEAYVPGTLQYSPPAPIAQTLTNDSGMFRIQSLGPGRYFVVPLDGRGMPTGAWATVSPDRGASVIVLDCSECPPPE